ncbi:hypothetical protein O3G_MSEX009055 [Manduca sexta]|uniref:Uncharacterized protein n=1 Tax=Manduca sexta TaxID=7130 RepID=A0A922CR37_MANSE|nr:hypothetical protein O3G_MSEX009055 [Manduca sexta]
MSFENITFRHNKNRTRTKSDSQSNVNELNELLNQTMNNTGTSLPDVSYDDKCNQEIISELKNKIEKLTIQLCSAEEEIELLSLENNTLKRSNKELMKKNELYKNIAYTPVKKSNSKQSSPRSCTKTKESLTKQTNTDITVRCKDT